MIRRSLEKLIFRPISALYAYAFALLPQILLFILSSIITQESTVVFALLYVGFASTAAFFFGRGPGVVAAIAASISVDYYYIQPYGYVLNSWRSFLFLGMTLVISLTATAIASWVASVLRSANQAKEVAENAIQEREQLMAIIAHDLRQPLSSISLQNEIAIDRIKANDFDGALNFLSKGGRTIKLMDHMIQDLMDVSQIESGKFRSNLKPQDLNSLLEESAHRLSDITHSKGITLSFSGIHHPAPVEADADQLHRVIFNLVGNSVKFTPAPGKVSVTLEERQNDYRVSVADTGPGVKPENVHFLFTKSWQDKQTAHLGSGLGLFICKGIINAHHGNVGYRPGLPTGATFYFTIPKEHHG